MQEHSIFLPFFLGISWFWFDFGFLRKSFSVKPWLSWNFLCIPGWSRILRFAGIKGLYHSCPAWLSFNIQEYLNRLLKSLVYFDSLKITHYSKIIKGTISNIKVYHWWLKDYRNSFFFLSRLLNFDANFSTVWRSWRQVRIFKEFPVSHAFWFFHNRQ